MARWVKGLVLSLQQLGLLLWGGFNPWPRNFFMPWNGHVQKKKKKIQHGKKTRGLSWGKGIELCV